MSQIPEAPPCPHRALPDAMRRYPHLNRLLDGLAMGVLLVDAGGCIRYANTQAERLLQRHDGLAIDSQQGLRAAGATEQAELQALMAGALGTPHHEARGTGGVLACHDTTGDGLLMVTVAALAEMAGYEALAGDGIAVAIFLTDPRARHRLSQPLLKRSFGLTDREASLCEAFLNSPSLEGVAASCHLSLSSVRTYMKEIYAKTGRRSQAELMHLLMSLRLDFEQLR